MYNIWQKKENIFVTEHSYDSAPNAEKYQSSSTKDFGYLVIGCLKKPFI